MFRQSFNALVRHAAGPGRRTFAAESADQKLVLLEVDDKSGIATLTLNRPPVNSLNLELLTDISKALDQVEENRSRGLILTSVRSVRASTSTSTTIAPSQFTHSLAKPSSRLASTSWRCTNRTKFA